MSSLATDDPVLKKRDSLALALGLSKARTIDVHRGTSSRLYLDFLHGKLESKWALDAVDIASLKVILELLPAFLVFSFWQFHAYTPSPGLGSTNAPSLPSCNQLSPPRRWKRCWA